MSWSYCRIISLLVYMLWLNRVWCTHSKGNFPNYFPQKISDFFLRLLPQNSILIEKTDDERRILIKWFKCEIWITECNNRLGIWKYSFQPLLRLFFLENQYEKLSRVEHEAHESCCASRCRVSERRSRESAGRRAMSATRGGPAHNA